MKWEYKDVQDPDAAKLVKLGQEGWELVSVVDIGIRRTTLIYFFKRAHLTANKYR